MRPWEVCDGYRECKDRSDEEESFCASRGKPNLSPLNYTKSNYDFVYNINIAIACTFLHYRLVNDKCSRLFQNVLKDTGNAGTTLDVFLISTSATEKTTVTTIQTRSKVVSSRGNND